MNFTDNLSDIVTIAHYKHVNNKGPDEEGPYVKIHYRLYEDGEITIVTDDYIEDVFCRVFKSAITTIYNLNYHYQEMV